MTRVAPYLSPSWTYQEKKQITILQEILSGDNISGKEIENIIESFAKVLTDCADKSLKKRRSKGKKKVKNAWYNKTFLEKRGNLTAML